MSPMLLGKYLFKADSVYELTSFPNFRSSASQVGGSREFGTQLWLFSAGSTFSVHKASLLVRPWVSWPRKIIFRLRLSWRQKKRKNFHLGCGVSCWNAVLKECRRLIAEVWAVLTAKCHITAGAFKFSCKQLRAGNELRWQMRLFRPRKRPDKKNLCDDFPFKKYFPSFLVEKRIEAHTKTTNISAETFSENLFLAQIFQIIINRVWRSSLWLTKRNYVEVAFLSGSISFDSFVHMPRRWSLPKAGC